MEIIRELLKIAGKVGTKKIYKYITKENIKLIISEYSDIIENIDYKNDIYVEEKFLYDIEQKNKINKIDAIEYANLLRHFNIDFNQIAYVIQKDNKIKEMVSTLEDRLCDQPFYINSLYKIVKKRNASSIVSTDKKIHSDLSALFAFYLYHLCIVGKKTKIEKKIYKGGLSPYKFNLLLPSIGDMYEDSFMLSKSEMIKKYGTENTISIYFLKEKINED